MLTYNQVQQTIFKYADEMAVPFADRFERFPQGGVAAMIANYLNDRAQFYYNFGCPEIGKECAEAAAEIIVRCG